MGMLIHFRAATEADMSRLIQMMRELYTHENLEHPPQAQRALKELIGDGKFGRCFLIEQDGQVVGYLVLGFGFSLEFGGRDAFLDELYVVPRARGAGIGKAAVRFAADVCKHEGIGALHLEVSRANEAGQRLYRGMGFSERHLNYDVLTLRQGGQ